MSKMTYETLLAECQRLRTEYEQGEARFFVFLMRAETEYQEVWKEFGHATFDTFLRSNHLCDVDRYTAFVRGVERSSVEKALHVGAATTISVGRLRTQSPEAAQEILRRADAFIATERVAPAEQTATEWRKDVERPDRAHVTIRRADELTKLREENRRLKVELKAAQRRIQELESAARPTGKRKPRRSEPQVSA